MKRISGFFSCIALLAAMTTEASGQQKSPEQRDIDYANCRSEFVARGMGDDDAANVYCTKREYGDEGPSTPGPTGRTYFPGPGRECYGSFTVGCDPVLPD
ncbi:hypothetical protein LPN01_12980 [Sphingomonas sp. A2-49]|uniref:hypothetical protein n=1 Tax=Sphingomonas sp. A2-49 TaxID=1391375 RepID=UPI0021CFEDD3|nr:hypothetical protein [Sphingomonas sp. A2-49]MCU6454993.1 hypothetical protein [Sphingomonas sp. A2-49]